MNPAKEIKDMTEMKEKDMLDEQPVQIVVNGRAAITLMTHAKNKKELVTGALITEKVIESVDDIESVLEDDAQVSVVTKNPYSILLSRKTVLAGCGGASSFLDSGKLGTVGQGPNVCDELLEKAVLEIFDTDWFAGALFSKDGVMIKSAEDISSQNVLDTLIGFAALNSTDLSNSFVAFRGNLVTETVRKAIIAKIPLLAFVGEITKPAANIAKEAELKLVRL